MHTLHTHVIFGLAAAAAAPAQSSERLSDIRVRDGVPSYRVERPAALLPDARASWARDINDRGLVIGTYRDDQFKRMKAFAWQDGALVETVLPQPNNATITPSVVPDVHRYVRGMAVNEGGLAIGNAYHRSFGVLYVGWFTPVPSPRTYPALHINAFGLRAWWTHDISDGSPTLVVGNGLVPGTSVLQDTVRGFATPIDPATGPSLQPGPAIIPALGGTRSRSAAHAVNRHRVVVGWAEQSGGFRRAISWDYDTRQITELGTLGGPSSAAWDISDTGWIVGEADRPGGVRHAFSCRAGGTMHDLGTLGGASSVARGVNDAGRIVGWSWTAAGEVHACLWLRGTIFDLNRTALSEDGWTLQYAEAINDAGQIVGWGRYRGETQGFVLTPRE